MSDGRHQIYPEEDGEQVDEPLYVNGAIVHPDGSVEPDGDGVWLTDDWRIDYDAGNDRIVIVDEQNEKVAYLDRNSSGDLVGSSTDTRTDVSDGGTTVVTDVEDINFASFLSVTDDNDGTVTVDGSDETIRTRQEDVPPTTISDGNHAPGVWKRVPTGKTLKLLEAGVQDSTQSAPTGLTIEVYDLTNAVTIMSKNALHVEGSPIASKTGAIDVEIRVANATGGSVDASGYVLYTME